MEEIKENMNESEDDVSENKQEHTGNTDTFKTSEKFSDVLIMQISLCIILLIIIVILNTLKPDISYYLIQKFKELSNGETEQVFKDAVITVKELIYDKIYSIRI